MAIRRKTSRTRSAVQAVGTAVSNSGLPFLKICPVPGLNCYACPLASFACPLGSLQHFLVLRQFPFALAGFFTAIGATFGRAACGWLCPFGFLQDILAKIGPRRKIARTQRFGWLRYVFLLGLVGAATFYVGVPLFCKICPAGTLEAGIPQVLLRPVLRSQITWRYWLKIGILAGFVLSAIFIKRPFCRFICPLGALYSPFNRLSLMRLEVDEDSCTKCGACKHVCPVDIEVYKDPNSGACVRCLECTRCDAVSVVWGRSRVQKDAQTAQERVSLAAEYPGHAAEH